MSTQTEHIGLHQWESTDPFLREDFNEDNRKIDQAVEAVEKQTRQTADSLENMSYNVFNLLLQNYYEGKYTGYKKALIFDGFRDESLIMSLTEGLAVKPDEKMLGLGTDAVPSNSTGSTTPGGDMFDLYNPVEEVVHIGGWGTLKQAVYGVGTRSASITSGAVICELCTINKETGNAEEILASTEVVLEGMQREELKEHILLLNFPVNFGDYILRLRCKEDSPFFVDVRNAHALIYEAKAMSSGTLLSTVFNIREGGKAAMAWIRYKNGEVVLGIGDGNGRFQDMEGLESRETYNLQGQSCKETEFYLEQLSGSETVQIRIQMNADEGGMSVYDYGVLFL